MESIHGHEVIEMIQRAGRPFSREGLIEAVAERFGAAARFHTCSAENLSPAELVDFLIAKGKFAIGEEGMTLDATQICQH